jgi:hypothetical protein
MNNKKDIRLDIIGKILSGKYLGWYVLFKRNSPTGNSYTIYISNTYDFSKATEGYDNWCINYESLLGYIEEYNWDIEWIGQRNSIT